MKIALACLVAGLGSCLLPGRTLIAQGRVSLTPFVGVYAPLNQRIVRTDTVGPPTTVTVTERTGGALGARLTLRPGGPLGYEASLVYVSADLKSAAGAPSFTTTSGPGTLLVASARALVRVGNTAVAGMDLIAGGTVIAHLGSWDDNWDRTTDLGGVLGLGMSVQLGKLGLRLNVEDHFFSASFEGSATTGVTESRLQNDLLLALGVAF